MISGFPAPAGRHPRRLPRAGSFCGLLATLALLTTGSSPVSAQVLRGRVIEADSTQPIRYATLDMLDDRSQVVATERSDSLGVFQIRSWTPGKYRLRVSALGYEGVLSDPLELATGDVLELTVRLHPDAIPLDPIVVEARARASLAELALSGYYGRRDAGRRLGLGRFFDRGAIELRSGGTITDILATIPGVRIFQVPNCSAPLISMAGNNFSRFNAIEYGSLVRPSSASDPCNPTWVCRANVYVDGVQMEFNESTSIDLLVPLDWVEAIEVYRRAAEVPAEFLSRANCGVVAIWTRRG